MITKRAYRFTEDAGDPADEIPVADPPPAPDLVLLRPTGLVALARLWCEGCVQEYRVGRDVLLLLADPQIPATCPQCRAPLQPLREETAFGSRGAIPLPAETFFANALDTIVTFIRVRRVDASTDSLPIGALGISARFIAKGVAVPFKDLVAKVRVGTPSARLYCGDCRQDYVCDSGAEAQGRRCPRCGQWLREINWSDVVATGENPPIVLGARTIGEPESPEGWSPGPAWSAALPRSSGALNIGAIQAAADRITGTVQPVRVGEKWAVGRAPEGLQAAVVAGEARQFFQSGRRLGKTRLTVANLRDRIAGREGFDV